MSGCEVVGVCDADVKHMAKAGQAAGHTASSSYTDFREVLARDDIDAVSIAAPDHWHVPMSVTAPEKRLDDDLPRIAEAYRHFLRMGQMPV